MLTLIILVAICIILVIVYAVDFILTHKEVPSRAKRKDLLKDLTMGIFFGIIAGILIAIYNASGS